MFHEIAGENSKREIRCGDFNAHNNLWRSSFTDKLKECYSEFERSKNMEGDIDEYTDTITEYNDNKYSIDVYSNK